MADFEVHLSIQGRTRQIGRAVAKEAGAAPAEIHRMASAFEHDELRQALAFSR